MDLQGLLKVEKEVDSRNEVPTFPQVPVLVGFLFVYVCALLCPRINKDHNSYLSWWMLHC